MLGPSNSAYREINMNKSMHNFSFTLVFISIISLFCSGVTSRAQTTLQVQDGQFELTFDSPENSCRLLSIRNAANQREYIVPKNKLWILTLKHTSGATITIGSDECDARIDISETGAQGVIHWELGQALERKMPEELLEDGDADGRRDMKVICRAEVDPDGCYLDLEVDNTSQNWSLHDVVFPYVHLGQLGESPDDDYILTPETSGRVTSNPLLSGLQLRHWGNAVDYLPYPSAGAPFQAFAYWDKAGGIYLSPEDPHGSTKFLGASSAAGDDSVEIKIKWAVPDATIPGNDFQSPGRFRMQFFEGDWFDAAQIYKEWVFSDAVWNPDLEARRSWLDNNHLWLNARGTPAEIVEPIKEFADFMDMPLAVHWYMWHQIPWDQKYPDYFPAEPGFAEAIEELQARNIKIVPYINGRVWDIGLDDFQSEALPATVKTIDQNFQQATFGTPSTFAVMCPTTETWQNKMNEIIQRLAGPEFGVDGVYIDMLAAAPPALCFDPSHNHPLGGGSWWIEEGYRPMLKMIREDLGSHNLEDTILVTESLAEPYAGLMDGYLTWDLTYQDMVPFFHAVYAGRAQMFGRRYGVTDGDTDQTAHRMKIAQALVFGEQLGWSFPNFIEQEAATYMKKAAHIRQELSSFVGRGQMLRPPEIAGYIPLLTADWRWLNQNWPITDSAIQRGAWSNKQGDVAFIFANASDSGIDFVWECDLAGYGFDKAGVSVSKLGSDETAEVSGNKYIENIRISPQEIRVYIFRKADTKIHAYWPLDEMTGTTAQDVAHNANGTLKGGLDFANDSVTGKYDSALSFDGVDDYIALGTGPALTGTLDFSISAWVKTTASGVIIQQRDGSVGGYNGQYIVRVNSDGTAGFVVYNDGYQLNFASTQKVNDGNWHHIVAVRQGNDGYIYVDAGTPATDSGPVKSLNGNLAVSIGADTRHSTNYFDGVIDEVKIYNHALTSQRVADIYNGHIRSDVLSPNDGSILLTERILRWLQVPNADSYDVYVGTDPTAVADATTASSEYRGTVTSNTFNAAEILTFNTRYFWRIDTVKADATATGTVWDFTTAPAEDMAGFYKLDQNSGTNAPDYSGHGNDGIVRGATWTTGIVGNALSFDGVDDFVELGTGPSLGGKTDFTISAWVKTKGTGTSDGMIIQQRDSGGFNGQYMLRSRADGFLQFVVYGDMGFQFNFNSAQKINAGQWHHVVAGRKGTEGFIYVDAGTPTTDTSDIVRNLDSSISVAIGADIRDQGSYFEGLIDDVRIYTRALSASEIDRLNSSMRMRMNQRDREGNVVLTGPDDGEIRYTLDGSTPDSDSNRYTGPIDMTLGGTINAVVYNGDGVRINTIQRNYLLLAPVGWRANADSQVFAAANAIDGNAETYWQSDSTETPHRLEIDMGKTACVGGFTYTPPIGGGSGTVTSYSLETSLNGIDWTIQSQGEFTGIASDSVRQEVGFMPVMARYLRLNPIDVVDGGNTVKVAELGVIPAGFDAWRRDYGYQNLGPDYCPGGSGIPILIRYAAVLDGSGMPADLPLSISSDSDGRPLIVVRLRESMPDVEVVLQQLDDRDGWKPVVGNKHFRSYSSGESSVNHEYLSEPNTSRSLYRVMYNLLGE